MNRKRSGPFVMKMSCEKDKGINIAATSDTEITDVEVDRGSTAGPVWQLRRRAAAVLSPISEMAFAFSGSTISTPTSAKPKSLRCGELKLLYECLKPSQETEESVASFNFLKTSSGKFFSNFQSFCIDVPMHQPCS